MFQFKCWASSMRHLPMGRGNKYINVAILTDSSFPSELRANPVFSKVSKLRGKLLRMWDTNTCGDLPWQKFTHTQFIQHSSGWESGDGWVVLTLHVKQIWCQINQKEETYLEQGCVSLPIYGFPRGSCTFSPCLNLLSCVECCRSSSKGMVLGGDGFQALAKSASQN